MSLVLESVVQRGNRGMELEDKNRDADGPYHLVYKKIS